MDLGVACLGLISALYLTSCAILGKSLDFSGLQVFICTTKGVKYLPVVVLG